MTAPAPIGPTTDARISAAFANGCTITAQAAAALLGFDVKTLREMTDAGLIRAVRVGTGSWRAYTEGDIRAYLMEGAAPATTATSKPPVRTWSSTVNVVPFTDRRRRKASGRGTEKGKKA
jgi:excisionase family DNA binding protein